MGEQSEYVEDLNDVATRVEMLEACLAEVRQSQQVVERTVEWIEGAVRRLERSVPTEKRVKSPTPLADDLFRNMARHASEIVANFKEVDAKRADRERILLSRWEQHSNELIEQIRLLRDENNRLRGGQSATA